MLNAHSTLKLLFNNISMLLFKTFKFSQTNNMFNPKIFIFFKFKFQNFKIGAWIKTSFGTTFDFKFDYT
jgi:hypothetical protein